MSQRDKLQTHFQNLCTQLKVEARPWSEVSGKTRGLGGLSCRADRIVWVPTVRSRASYAVAMHELGHVLGPWQHKGVLYQEAGAWKWAKANALQWGSVETKTMHKGLWTYFLSAVQRQMTDSPKEYALPPRGHFFWECLPPIMEPPAWLAEKLPLVPWNQVLSHPQRPRCSTCAFWKGHHEAKTGEMWGTCVNPTGPLGTTPLVPADALCGKGYFPLLR